MGSTCSTQPSYKVLDKRMEVGSKLKEWEGKKCKVDIKINRISGRRRDKFDLTH